MSYGNLEQALDFYKVMRKRFYNRIYIEIALFQGGKRIIKPGG
jgi:hypothetical protein